MLKRLASTYFEQGKFDRPSRRTAAIIAEDPNGPAAPDFQNEIVQSLTKMGKKEDADRRDRQPPQDLRQEIRVGPGERREPGRGEGRRRVHREGPPHRRDQLPQRGEEAPDGRPGRRTYALAEKAYEVYLQEFPDSKYSYDVRYGYSELLYTIKKFDIAYDQYMKVVAIDPKGSTRGSAPSPRSSRPTRC